MQLDHLILEVDDVQASLDFYKNLFGFTDAGPDGPFHMMRVSPDVIILLAPRRTTSTLHLAFAMTHDEFDAVLAKLKAANIDYGDAYDSVGSGKGPAVETGARGKSKSIYLYDRDRHLIEILYYEASSSSADPASAG